MGGRAWLDGQPLYADGAMFETQAGLDLPFTYPPLAAIAFAPFALLPLSAASAAITVTTFVLLIVSTVIVLTRLDVWPQSSITAEPAWLRRCWLAAAIVAPAVVYLEPIRANFDFGQINVVLMTLVIADCVPRKTPWPRGLLLGVAIALKLTPAVFLLYFVLRRDTRALIVTVASAVVGHPGRLRVRLARLLGVLDRHGAQHRPDRHRDAEHQPEHRGCAGPPRPRRGRAIRAVDAGLLRGARGDDLGDAARCCGAERDPVLALICVAMFGLVVSPVSWSHHWVWALPTVMVCSVVAYRHRHALLGAVTAAGVALMVWTPITLMPEHHETTASLWRQLVGGSYVWWALAVIVVAGTVSTRPDRLDSPRPSAPHLCPLLS